MQVGARVRMVQTASRGTVTGGPFRSPADGGDRVMVAWDGSGEATAWHPGFLRPADSDPALDPDQVRVGVLVRQRGSTKLDRFGTVVVTPDGFFKVNP